MVSKPVVVTFFKICLRKKVYHFQKIFLKYYELREQYRRQMDATGFISRK